jgi:hypothetical protein
MNKSIFSLLICCLVVFLSSTSQAANANLDWLNNKLKTASSTKLNETQIGSGLKEALQVGIQKTIKLLGKQDGYLANQDVKILLPKNMQSLEPTLRKIGFGPQIDEFTLSMNRAAEKAAPLAADIFSSAITNMSFDDAKKILDGSNTAASDYLRSATYSKLLEAFKPSVTKAMNEFAVTKKYEEISGKVKTLPFMNKLAGDTDITGYVSAKALDGLFKVLSQQEANIRTNPAARATDLLKKVFSK